MDWMGLLANTYVRSTAGFAQSSTTISLLDVICASYTSTKLHDTCFIAAAATTSFPYQKRGIEGGWVGLDGYASVWWYGSTRQRKSNILLLSSPASTMIHLEREHATFSPWWCYLVLPQHTLQPSILLFYLRRRLRLGLFFFSLLVSDFWTGSDWGNLGFGINRGGMGWMNGWMKGWMGLGCSDEC